LVQFIRFF